MSDRSRYCDSGKHAECDGKNRVIDQDGHSTYTCSCSCHTERSTCANCGAGIERQKGSTWQHGYRGSDKCPVRYAKPTPVAADGAPT